MLAPCPAVAVDPGAPKGEAAGGLTLDYELAVANDRYEWGLNEVDHTYSVETSLTLRDRGWFATLWAANSHYDTKTPDAELKLVGGLLPRRGNWTLMLIGSRDHYAAAPAKSYNYALVMPVYNFGGGLSAGLGYTHYWWDRLENFNEIYLRADYTPGERCALKLEAVYDFNYDKARNDYIELIGGIDVRLTKRVGLEGEAGFEHYYTDRLVPSFVWYKAGGYVVLTEGLTFGLHYYGSDLGPAGCALVSANDCDDGVVASLTLDGSWRPFAKRR